MLPEFQTMEKYDFLRPIIYSRELKSLLMMVAGENGSEEELQ